MTDLDQRTVRALVRAMPKAELHLHLDGSLRIDTALDIARTRGIDAPTTFAGMRGVLVGPEQSTDQAELLEAFDLPIALMQDAEAIERISADLVEDKARDNVRYAEIRWAPLLHTEQGADRPAGRRGDRAKGARRAAAAGGIEVRLIATLMRSHPPEAQPRVRPRPRGERRPGRPRRGRPRRARGALPRPDDPRARRSTSRARSASTSPSTPASGAARRRSGARWSSTRSGSPTGRCAIDDPALVAELIRRGTWLDLCPTSNVQARIVPTLEDHPLLRLKRAGVRVTLNTDDLTVSDISLSDEYERAVMRIGVSIPELWAARPRGHRGRVLRRRDPRPPARPSSSPGARGSRSSSRPSGRGRAS